MKKIIKTTHTCLTILFSIGLHVVTMAQAKSHFTPVNTSNIKVGQTAPNVSFTDIQGKTINTSNYIGKILVLDVWATWCAPCIAGMPELNKIQTEHQDDLVVLAVCSADKLENFNAFVGKHKDKYRFQFLFDKNGMSPKATDFRTLYGINGFPTTMVIDQQGNLAGYGFNREELELHINHLTRKDTAIYTLQQVIDDNRSGKYREAYRKSLFVSAETDSAKNDLIYTQIEALIHFDDQSAIELGKKRTAENGNEYQFISNLGSMIAQTTGLSAKAYLYGAEVLKNVVVNAPDSDGFFIIYDLLGRCLFHAGKIDEAISYAEKSVENGKKTSQNSGTMTYLENVLEKYKQTKLKTDKKS